MQDFRIRPAVPEDAGSIASVHVRSWQQTYRGQLPDEYLDRLVEDIPRRKEVWQRIATTMSEKAALFVAVVGGETVGFVNVNPSRDEDLDPQTFGELGVIYLLEEFWGQGIGKALHDEGMNYLRGAGFTNAMLWVLDSNERTRRWYERQGWRVDSMVKTDDRGTFVLNEVRYIIQL
ncbi:MAG: GNAT family N-acetyltransferase [Actinobacteria bacterium]|nr:GNAT family N-acetyltransferase [Actinomycetota bacterium]